LFLFVTYSVRTIENVWKFLSEQKENNKKTLLTTALPQAGFTVEAAGHSVADGRMFALLMLPLPLPFSTF
jgi:hypothetical protein